MKVQWSLRTLLIVMTLGGPLLAAGVSVASKVAKYWSPYEEADCGHFVRKVIWVDAMCDAQQVQELSARFQEEDRRKAELTRDLPPENSLHEACPID